MGELVECRSDWEYAQRPQAFTWQGRRLVVQDIRASYSIPTGKRFLVLTTELGDFELDYDLDLDQWIIHPRSSKENV